MFNGFTLVEIVFLTSQLVLVSPIAASQDSTFIDVEGNILIAGLSPIHYPLGAVDDGRSLLPAPGAHCDGHFNFRGLQHAEAILYAVDKINEDKTLLPKIRLGVDIRDTCNSVDYAIREALQFSFVREAYKHASNDDREVCETMSDTETTMKTVAIVGAAYSGISMAITNLAGLFYVPVVSYASTSRLLSDRRRFKYFLRTVPSDTLQAQAMVDIITEFKWPFVAAIASDTEYGRSGIEAFKSAVSNLRNVSICIAADAVFTTRTPKEEVIRIIRRLKKQKKARVIVLFAELNDAEYFIKTANEENLTDKIWIGSDAFAKSYRVLDGNEDILKHWIAVLPASKEYKPFIDYFFNMTEYRKQRNPWLRIYEEEIQQQMNLGARIEISPYTTPAIDAVYAVAHGLHIMYNCTEESCEKDVTQTQQMKVYDFIKGVSFESPTGNCVSFDDGGSAGRRYQIVFVEHHKSFNSPVFSFLGEWDQIRGLRINRSSGTQIPFKKMTSSCSEPCKLGFRKRPHRKFAECCWNCIRCRDNTITNQSGSTTCITCPPGSTANHERSSCDIIPPTLIVMTTAGFAVICACAVGTLVVIVTLIVFVKYQNSPVVRASSREISYIILAGIAWNFTNAIAFIIQPSETLCQLRPFLASTGIATVIGSLLSKTNRIARIFSLKTMRTGKPCFVSNKWQLGFVSICVVLGNLVAGAWVVISPYRVITVPHGRGEVTIECDKGSSVGFAVWATYHVGLTILCTYQAFLVRKVPENYNEAKFIAFTMVTLCITAIVYVPTYYGTTGIYRAVLTAFLFIFCSYATLVCLFGPKMYIILVRPDKNVPLAPRLESSGSISFKPQYNRSISGLTTLSIYSTTSNPTLSTSNSFSQGTRDSNEWLRKE